MNKFFFFFFINTDAYCFELNKSQRLILHVAFYGNDKLAPLNINSCQSKQEFFCECVREKYIHSCMYTVSL